MADEAFEGFDAEAELARRKGALVAEPAFAQTGELIGRGVLGAVDDPQVLRTAALDAGLHDAARSAMDARYVGREVRADDLMSDMKEDFDARR